MSTSDLGIKLVTEFHKTFNCIIGIKPEVPTFKDKTFRDLSTFQFKAAEMASELNNMASAAKSNGDESGALLLIRLQLIQEELAELALAMRNRDIVECFDALIDLSYVVDGTYISLGLQDKKEEGLLEVHRSNMSKLGKDGKPIFSPGGRVKKGPNYSKPDLKKVLES